MIFFFRGTGGGGSSRKDVREPLMAIFPEGKGRINAI
jgi:hypothetical protein